MEYNRLQFHLEATAGTQRLWKSWGRMTGTQWAMTDTEAPGKVRTSPDRFNLKRMKARAYKLPEGTPDRWTKFDESQWLAESGVVRGHMKENPVMAKIDVLIEQAEKAPYKSLVRRTMGREVPPRDKSVDTWRSEFIAFIRRNRWPDGREVPSGYASLGRLDYSGEREPNNMYYDSRSAFMETWEQFMLTRPWEKEAKNPMTCAGCGKAISGAYEAGSYSCSGCGAGVEVNPSTSGDKTPMPRVSVMSDSLGWKQQQKEMQEQLCVHCGVPATATAYGKFQQTRESRYKFFELEAEGLHWCCVEHQGLHAGGNNPVKYDEYGRPIKKKAKKPKAQKPTVEGLTPEQVDKIDDILSFTSTVGELDIALSIGRTVDERFKTDITAYKVVLDGRVNMPIGLFEVPTDAPADTHSDAQMAGRVVHEAIQKYLAQK